MRPEAIERAVERWGTPLYLYDARILRGSCASLLSAFQGFGPHFSLKANPSPGLCGIIARAGFGAEVSSTFEAEIALRAGFDPDEMLYDGPAKTEAEIAHALRAGIHRFNFESPSEVHRILQTCTATGIRPDLRLCARLNPLRTTSAGEVMTGASSRFGIDEERLIPWLEGFSASGARIRGIHLYIGSQILDSDEIVRNFRMGLDALSLISERGLLAGEAPAELVFGAGMGVAYGDGEDPPAPERLAERMRRLLRAAEPGLRPVAVRMEIGRALVAPCGAYIVRVVESKVSRGVRYLLVDGGIHHFMRYALTGARHRILPVGREWGETSPAFVTGATCTPYDVLTECETGEVAEGDLLCLRDTGAYGWSMGLANFLSRPTPPEVLDDDDGLHLLRRRSELGDLLALCAPPQ